MSALPDSHADRRQGQRRRTLVRGRICYGDYGVISLSCTIRNISSDGALLSLRGNPPLPSKFTLLHVLDGVAFDARLAWRKGDLVGVILDDRQDLKGVVDAQVQGLRDMWLALASS